MLNVNGNWFLHESDNDLVTVATTLSPWELWLLRKTEDERRRFEKERQEKVG